MATDDFIQYVMKRGERLLDRAQYPQPVRGVPHYRVELGFQVYVRMLLRLAAHHGLSRHW
ncbi:MAG: hypothetical protein AUI14_21445 [Actinobacteria bacterium 13_2_20CM_2_71_6]|nr:MAG: hypothetical protein AUI14_21445 [Actinobacteria bacterium 13_2_20CM_2_71_6]